MSRTTSSRTRVVLLGASNLTLGLPTVLATARSVLGPDPLDVFVAAGHGRSYGRWSRVGLRGLPGILDCGLWPAAVNPGRVPTYALVTDIGNDLAYGASAADLAGWVSVCADRLRELGADIVFTLLPVRSLSRLRPWQYHLFRTALFPGCRLPFPALHKRVAEVNERLAALASRARVKLIEPEAHWYGADAIHLHRSQRATAWKAILSGWEAPPGVAPSPTASAGRLSCRGMAPAWRTLAGLTLRRPQPSGLFEDGTTISLF